MCEALALDIQNRMKASTERAAGKGKRKRRGAAPQQAKVAKRARVAKGVKTTSLVEHVAVAAAPASSDTVTFVSRSDEHSGADNETRDAIARMCAQFDGQVGADWLTEKFIADFFSACNPDVAECSASQGAAPPPPPPPPPPSPSPQQHAEPTCAAAAAAAAAAASAAAVSEAAAATDSTPAQSSAAVSRKRKSGAPRLGRAATSGVPGGRRNRRSRRRPPTKTVAKEREQDVAENALGHVKWEEVKRGFSGNILVDLVSDDDDDDVVAPATTTNNAAAAAAAAAAASAAAADGEIVEVICCSEQRGAEREDTTTPAECLHYLKDLAELDVGVVVNYIRVPPPSFWARCTSAEAEKIVAYYNYFAAVFETALSNVGESKTAYNMYVAQTSAQVLSCCIEDITAALRHSPVH